MRRRFLTITFCLLAGNLAARASDNSALLATCAAKPATRTGDTQKPSANAISLRLLRAQIRAGTLDDAGATAQPLADSAPDDPNLQVALGELYYAQRKTALAVVAFNRAAQLDPCNGRAHYFAWRFMSLAGRIPESIEQLDLARHLSPQDKQIDRTWLAVQLALKLESAPDAPRVMALNPPIEGYFAKTLDCDGVPVRSSAAVDSMALVLACGRIRPMFEHLPKARKILIGSGGELHIIGDRGKTTDLPENARFRGDAYIDAEGHSTDMDARTRGVGGLKSSCGEENLLHLPNDRYEDGFDTCTHEFSHDLMDNGFTRQQRNEIEKQYRDSLSQGLWKGAYAAVNVKEYWAELSMWYFGAHGTFVPGGLSEGGPEALRAYDPGGFALLERIYTGEK